MIRLLSALLLSACLSGISLPAWAQVPIVQNSECPPGCTCFGGKVNCTPAIVLNPDVGTIQLKGGVTREQLPEVIEQLQGLSERKP